MVNSKELKEKIISELKMKNLADAESMLGIRRENFTEEDFWEVHLAIAENIKSHINEWRIEEVVTFNGYYGGDFYGEKKETILFHQSAQLGKYDELGTLVVDPRKMQFKESYPIERWKEIENALNNQHQEDTPSIPSSQEQQTQQEQPLKQSKDYIYHRDNKY